MNNTFRAATLVLFLTLTAPMFAGPIGGVPRPPVKTGGNSGSSSSTVSIMRIILGF